MSNREDYPFLLLEFNINYMAAENKKLSLKLLVDKKKEVVLFAETGKEVVDLIFHLLALPMGSVVRMLSKDAMVGSLGNIYESVETLNPTYLQSTSNTDALLKPKTPSYGGGSSETILLPVANNSADSTQTHYRCNNNNSQCDYYVSHNAKATCPRCRNVMSRQLTMVEAQAADAGAAVQSNSSGGGYVKGLVTYMVMDNLVVKPMSTISSITLLNKFNVTDLSALEEKVVDFGYEEAVKLLRASMESTNVLTSVFLGGKKRAAPAPAH